MAAAQVPATSRVAQKWARRAASAGQEYSDGVSQTTRSWATAAGAAAANFASGVQAAIARGGFAKGVAKAGDAKWKKNALAKGPARFAEGVAVAEPDYMTGVGPYLEAIGRTDLPPRGPVGSAGNLARVGAIANALRQLKVGR